MMNNAPIGIFDSGKGGLTVLAEVKEQLPQESVIYYGDVARVPFGNKTPEEIVQINFEIISYLIERGVKLVIIACNTSSAIAIKQDQDEFKIPIVGIQRGAHTALALTKNHKIGIAATQRTVNSHIYRKEIEEAIGAGQQLKVIEVACPDFVPLVESGKTAGPEVVAAVQKYLRIFKDEQVDTVIHGCTHYPYLEQEMRNYLGAVNFVDPAVDTVREAKRILEQNGLLSEASRARYEYVISQIKGDEYVRVDGREYLLRSTPAYR